MSFFNTDHVIVRSRDHTHIEKISGKLPSNIYKTIVKSVASVVNFKMWFRKCRTRRNEVSQVSLTKIEFRKCRKNVIILSHNN